VLPGAVNDLREESERGRPDGHARRCAATDAGASERLVQGIHCHLDDEGDLIVPVIVD
jgi:hypothetical protein